MFRSAQEAELELRGQVVKLHDLAEYRGRHREHHILTTVGRIIFNERVERALEEALGEEYDPQTYEFVNTPLRKRDMNNVIERLVDVHGPYATALVLDAFKELGFHFATQAGITVSKNDVVIPPNKDADPRGLREGSRRDPGAVRHRPHLAGGAQGGGRSRSGPPPPRRWARRCRTTWTT